MIAAVRGGTDIEFRYRPFSLDQVHVPEGEPPVWDREPGEWGSGVLSLLYVVSYLGLGVPPPATNWMGC